MIYDFDELKVIHWDFNRNFPEGYFPGETELFLRREIFSNPTKGFFKALIRWTYRIRQNDEPLLSYVTEQDFHIKYVRQPDNHNRLKLMYATSLLQASMEFDKRKIGTPMEITSIPHYDIPQQELEDIIALFEAETP